MLQRRLAIVGIATVLGLAGLAGSALADDGPAVVREPGGKGPVAVRAEPGEPVRAGGRMTCRVEGGKAVRLPKGVKPAKGEKVSGVVKLSRAKVAELVEEKVIDPAQAWELAPDGVTVVPAERVVIALPARELPRRVVGEHRRPGRAVHLTCVWTEFSAR
ncbi:hypothetical protein [Nonomuraea sp. NPDC050783]|uniref:hypothetical protein n=1 Tax=Nonomuraea sp. NPDC050783 TaxID=3154634 RepID=UPI003465DC27